MSTQTPPTSHVQGTRVGDIEYETLFGKEAYPSNPLDSAKMNEPFGENFLLQDLAGHAETPTGRRASLTGSLPPGHLQTSHGLLTGPYDIHQFDTPPGSRNTWSAARSPRPDMGQRSRSNSLTGELEPLLDHLIPHLPQPQYNPGTPGTPAAFKHDPTAVASTVAAGAAPQFAAGGFKQEAQGGIGTGAIPAVGSAIPADRDGTGRGIPLSPAPVSSVSTPTPAGGNSKREKKESKRKHSMPAEEKAKIRAEQSRTSSRLYRMRKKEFQQHLEQHCDALRQQQERTNKELAAAQELIHKLQEENNALRNLVQSLQAPRR